jgi:hypothetical protein
MQAAHHYAIDERAPNKCARETFARHVCECHRASRICQTRVWRHKTSAVATLPAEDYIASASAVMLDHPRFRLCDGIILGAGLFLCTGFPQPHS